MIGEAGHMPVMTDQCPQAVQSHGFDGEVARVQAWQLHSSTVFGDVGNHVSVLHH